MELTKLKDNTYLISAFSCSLLYVTGPGRCVLLDTPLAAEYEELEALLQEAGLRPTAVILSHVHHDHSGCVKRLQAEYGAQICASLGEAGAAISPTALSDYMGFISPGLLIHSFLKDCVFAADRVILPGETKLSLDGADFPILPSPGHSPGHICTETPDGVLFCGDALVSLDEVARQKMTYSLGIADHIASARRLAGRKPQLAVVSHRGVVPGADFARLCQVNIDHLEACVESLLEVIQAQPMGLDDICAAYCLGLNMTRVTLEHPQKALMVRRVALSYVEYLIDTGRVQPHIQGGVFRFSRIRKEHA